MDNLLLTLHNITSPKIIAKINAGMPEIHRATQNFGRQNSQTTGRLMSLTMLTAGSPYRMLRQCLAEIAKRRKALNEVYYDLKIDEIKATRLSKSDDEIDIIMAEKLKMKIEESRTAIQGALKDIASFIDAYDQIRDANNIRKDWDEVDFEKAETEHHLRTIFQHGYRDVMMNGRLGAGTLEYAEQFGLHPQILLNEAGQYVASVAHIDSNTRIDSSHFHDWMSVMAEKYKHLPDNAAKQLGLQSIITPWALRESAAHI
ncbi:hypothetical protein [Desulfobacter vibrioformis]|uniref:hypothetical protein n=1 Tax=Desulfobacter vibrioformis TaxID=34031 RepID=UPI000552BAB8|nr:hypothetical protein [Desulfobacter vibrioformis]